MRLDLSTWLEVEAYLTKSSAIVLPTGSNEQHGPMGLIGTDAICAEVIATRAANKADALVAPTLAYTPAPFNLAFPGSTSISPQTFRTLIREIVEGLASQGFKRFYFLNGHGANIEPILEVAGHMEKTSGLNFRLRSWWDFEPVNILRGKYYGDWEGMHATPSEVAITQALHRSVPPGMATDPPQKLSTEYMKAHAGDKHGPPEAHRAAFPDGRVGSHSALARPEHGKELLEAATRAVAEDYLGWSSCR